MGILGVWHFGDFDAPQECRPERIALAAYNLGCHPFLLRVWPEYISWASWPNAAVESATEDLDFYTEDDPPPVDREKLRCQVQQLRYHRQEELRNAGRDALPAELADLQDALRELASAGVMDVVRLVELHEAVDRLRTLFQAVLRAYRAADDGELRWLLMREEHPWHDLVESARAAIQGNVDAQRWCELGFLVGRCLACTSFPDPRDIMPADLQQMEKVATALAPKDSTPWQGKLAAFLKAAKVPVHDDWLNHQRRSATALVAADIAIRETLDTAAGLGPWLIIDHVKGEFTLFGQVLPFTAFPLRGLKLFLVLASRPSEKVDALELLTETDLKVDASYLASYITRDVRAVLKPIVAMYATASGVDDPEAIKYSMVLSERKRYMVTSDPGGYRLAIPPRLVRRIQTPLPADQQEQLPLDN